MSFDPPIREAAARLDRAALGLRPPPERSRRSQAGVALALVGLAGLGLAATRRRPSPPPPPDSAPSLRHAAGEATAADAARASAARRARQGGAMLALSAGIDSAMEHYRGDFHHRAMVAPPIASAATVAASAAPGRAPRTREAAYATSFALGLVGHVFHARNILNRPGGVSWENLFYAAPIGAPGALALAGLSGLAAMGLERRALGDPRRTGRLMAAGTVAGLLGTSAEVGLLHYRGAFHNPAMYIPLVLPPVAALAVAEAARRPDPRRIQTARGLLKATAAMGLIGVAFHAWGVSRNMGGWRNWSQNLQVAPPLPAPPGFTGVALAGLGAIDLLEASP